MNESENVHELYGSGISYFTGKLEMYFRARGIRYVAKPLTAGRVADEIHNALGSSQMPALRLADGQWLSDSTAIIQWMERDNPDDGVIPRNPALRFYSLLLEDFADEWLWRPAMHYRWHYPLGAHYAGQYLGIEIGAESIMPGWLKRFVITQRQRRGYTRGDGIGDDAVAGVEQIYLDTLDALQAMLADRPFMLGSRPSLADAAFSGPFFRHFGLDPVPADIMRERAPAVYAWLGRQWEYTPDQGGEYLSEMPADWTPILEAIGRAYLPYLNANVRAVRSGARQINETIDGVPYRGGRISRYRIWCLQQLREAYEALEGAVAEDVRNTLEATGVWGPLWEEKDLPISDDLCAQLPFHVDAKMIEVYR